MCLLVYDALFTVCHFAMHKSPLLYRRVHAVHHRKTVQRATEVRGSK